MRLMGRNYANPNFNNLSVPLISQLRLSKQRGKSMNFIGIDQYGQHYYINKHPRKELLEQLGASHASKMYIDDGVHTGYVIQNLWIDVFKIKPFKES
jgi:hypothetical protein